MLAKALRPPPDRYHGMGDQGSRYRYRELDLLANERTREMFFKRTKMIEAIHDFLRSRGFTQVETPMLQTLAGGAASRPFVTHHNALDIDVYLRISVELYLNRCIVGGLENIYDLGRAFRNEGTLAPPQPGVHDPRVDDVLRGLLGRREDDRRDGRERRAADARDDEGRAVRRAGHRLRDAMAADHAAGRDQRRGGHRLPGGQQRAAAGGRSSGAADPDRDVGEARRRGLRQARRTDALPADARLRLPGGPLPDLQAPLRTTPGSPSTSTR